MSSKHQTESKVRKYIQRVKQSDEEGIRRKGLPKREVCVSLEELYDVNIDADTSGPSTSKTDVNWTRTLREIKEKDMLILKLRQSVSDLAIKCANAENTIDELRCQRGHKVKTNVSTDKKDVMVETDNNTRVLEQQCVDWLEKVQNWRADTVLYSSHEESCGDSGFKGSELEVKNTLMTTTILNTTTTTTTHTATEDDCSPAQNNINTCASTSKDNRSLDPLFLSLDEATKLAKRVKEKSIRLSQMLTEQ